MESSPDLSVEDIAPVLGQQLLEIIALRKEVLRLRRELEAHGVDEVERLRRHVAEINGAPV